MSSGTGTHCIHRDGSQVCLVFFVSFPRRSILPNMDRQRLDEMSLEQLLAEAIRLQLKVVDSREVLIDEIMTHMERNSPLVDMLYAGGSMVEPQRMAAGRDY